MAHQGPFSVSPRVAGSQPRAEPRDKEQDKRSGGEAAADAGRLGSWNQLKDNALLLAAVASSSVGEVTRPTCTAQTHVWSDVEDCSRSDGAPSVETPSGGGEPRSTICSRYEESSAGCSKSHR
ncbi:unnamed protein product [Boreogadus saida]